MNEPKKRWWVALLEIIIPNSKQLVVAYTLFLGIGGVSGYIGHSYADRDKGLEPEKVIAEKAVPESAKPVSDVELLSRICGDVVSKALIKHEEGPRH